MQNNTKNRQSAAKLPKEINLGESSTTSQKGVDSSESKRSTSIIKIDEDIVWSLNENLERFNKKYHYIYKTTNIITGSFYIGRHSTNNLRDDYKGSGKRLKREFKKYGRKSFISEILYFCSSFVDLVNLEKSIVNFKLLEDPKCINIVTGGLSPILIGKNNPNYNRKLTKKQREFLSKMAKARVGALNPFYGKKHSKKTKKLFSKIASSRIGKKNPFFGKTHTNKTKKLISDKIKRKYKENPVILEKIRKKRSEGIYYTPEGNFITSRLAAEANKLSKATILLRCRHNCDKITGNNYQVEEEFRSDRKTWRDFGFYFIKSNKN